jgi:hypothetical protein
MLGAGAKRGMAIVVVGAVLAAGCGGDSGDAGGMRSRLLNLASCQGL